MMIDSFIVVLSKESSGLIQGGLPHGGPAGLTSPGHTVPLSPEPSMSVSFTFTLFSPCGSGVKIPPEERSRSSDLPTGSQKPYCPCSGAQSPDDSHTVASEWRFPVAWIWGVLPLTSGWEQSPGCPSCSSMWGQEARLASLLRASFLMMHTARSHITWILSSSLSCLFFRSSGTVPSVVLQFCTLPLMGDRARSWQLLLSSCPGFSDLCCSPTARHLCRPR